MKKIIIYLTIILNMFSILYAKQVRDLTLEQCIDLGIKNNFDIEKTELDKKIAKMTQTETEGMYEPMFESTVGRTELSYSSNKLNIDILNVGIKKLSKLTGAGVSINWKNKKDDSLLLYNPYSPRYNTEVAFSYAQPVLKNAFGKNYKKLYTISNVAFTIQDMTLDLQKNALANRIEKAYYDLDYSRINLRAQKLFLKRAKKLLDINKEKFKDGLVEEVDVISTEAVLKIREALLMLAEDMLNNSIDTLKKTIGLRVDVVYNFLPSDIFEEYKIRKPIKRDDVIKKALKQRLDRKILEKSLVINDFDRLIKKNEQLPALDVIGQISRMGIGNSWEGAYDSMQFVWYVGLNLSFYPFNKKNSSTFLKSKYNRQKSMVDLKDKETDIIRECIMAVRQINTQISYIKAALTAHKLQKRKLELEQIKFETGRSSIQWLLSFQDDLNSSEVTLYEAIANYYKALSDLKFITGE